MRQESCTDEDLFSVRFADARAAWIVGENGTILTTRDRGESWEKPTSGTYKALGDVHFVDARAG